MKKFFILIFLIMFSSLQTYAFEDYIITTKGKLTDIRIEDNKIIDVYPLVTLTNKKNILIVNPLNTGKTRFCLLKNNKDIIMFNVEITENKTTIDAVKGFDILKLDIPFEELELDFPPQIKEAK